MNNNLTPEQQKDIEERAGAFQKEYLELIAKYQVDFFCYPQFVPQKEGVFGTMAVMTIIDKKFAPIPSPLDMKPDNNIIK